MNLENSNLWLRNIRNGLVEKGGKLMKNFFLVSLIIVSGMCFVPYVSYADVLGDVLTEYIKACTWDGKGYDRGDSITASCTATPGGSSQGLSSTTGIKSGAQCTFKCHANDSWKITVTQAQCATGYTVREDARGCDKAEQTQCKLESGAVSKLGETATYDCSKTDLANIPNILPGAKCQLTCKSSGWSKAELRDGSCQEGYKPSQNRRQCLATKSGNFCTSTGGTWNSGTGQCTCDVAKELEMAAGHTDRCACRGGKVWSPSANACMDPGTGRTTQEEKVHQQNIVAQQQATVAAGNRRNACTASGGTMPGSKCVCDAAKYMVVSSGVCTCMSGYEWVTPGTPSQGCKITDKETVKRACDVATNGTWNPTTQKCVCNDADYEIDINAQTCKPVPALAECQPLMAQNKARWDATNKACKCTQEGYALEDGECKETAEGATKRKANELATAKAKIENVHSKLKKTQDGFKVSAWKNEDGNFNTARLASDSIAGVVVGTAGGLLTSKIVKKNQVEDGFEDIQCTIGGQTVAGWGDEFSVGNQM